MANSTPPRQVILVDTQDTVIGTADLLEAHRGKGKLHRASSVLLHNSKGEWLIQQRSSSKIVAANQWANTCCGNLCPGESYEECALRRLEEELGIVGVELKKIGKFQYQVQCNDEFSEHEIDTVFEGEFDGKLNFNPHEVKDVDFVDTENLVKQLHTSKQRQFAPWTRLVLQSHPDFKGKV